MDFKDLNKQLLALECGDMPTMPIQYQQPETINMNVAINGQGKNSIKDIIDILRNIDGDETQSDSEPDDDDILLGKLAGDEIVIGDEYDDYANNVDTNVYDVDSIIPTGDDLSSKGKEAPKQAGGGNPFNLKETLRSKLSDLYFEVKSR